ARVTDPARLKLELAVHGARLDQSVRLARSSEPVRSLDLVLADDVCVDVPIEDRYTAGSPFLLVADERRTFVVRRTREGVETARVEVRPLPRPRFYDRLTSAGTPMARVAALKGRHLLVSPTGTCGFSVRGTPCRFCVEGARAHEREPISVADVVEV